jgi:hypothetical protein
MKRNRNGPKGRGRTLRVWDYEQARGVLGYLSSILHSLREQWLQAIFHDRAARRLADRPGRPDRTALVAQQEAAAEARKARERFDETLKELHALDVYCLDPVRGEAIIPFVHEKQLAWFVFDLFDGEQLRTWRYHTDPPDTRRPVAEVLGEKAEDAETV